MAWTTKLYLQNAMSLSMNDNKYERKNILYTNKSLLPLVPMTNYDASNDYNSYKY